MAASRRQADIPKNAVAAAGSAPLPAAAGNETSIMNIAPDRGIFLQGARSDSVFFLHSGWAKISVLAASGKEAVLSIIGPGSFFGEGSLIGNARRLTTVTAITECTIERITTPTMKRALQEQPNLRSRLMDQLVLRNLRLQEDLIDQHLHSTEKRLARILLRMVKSDEPEAALPRVSQALLANTIGTTRARVNSFMNKFRQAGMIEYNGKLVVHPSLSDVLRQG
jgi:CRP/FNR family transcriptional regulator, cyclic AMP receptor protein